MKGKCNFEYLRIYFFIAFAMYYFAINKDAFSHSRWKRGVNFLQRLFAYLNKLIVEYKTHLMEAKVALYTVGSEENLPVAGQY